MRTVHFEHRDHWRNKVYPSPFHSRQKELNVLRTWSRWYDYLSVPAYFDATLEYISPKGIPQNGAVQFDIRAAVTLAEGDFIRAGFSANADVVLDKREQVLAISEALVQYEGPKPFVEVQTGPQQFERRDVELGLSDGLTVEVLSGVAEGDSLKRWNQPIFD